MQSNGALAPLDAPGTGTNAASSQPKKVAYFYDSDVGNYAYNAGHPMKPHRIRMAHSLIMNYGLYKKLEIYRAKPASKYEMTQFHTDEYVDFLQRVTPDNMDSFAKEQGKYNVGDDCPVFDGLFEFCGISAGGSMEGAARLNRGKCDVAINWAGGLHHAKKSEASGFCYINDIVLGIIELLRFHPRVLYLDIDVHHGDGVEEAFYATDRVMTVSFHKYGEYFPGTGELRDIGVGAGKHYAINFPLRDGIDDRSYKSVFEDTVCGVMEYYRPDAVVLQCGGDSLSGDRLGCFNLSMRGHANCVNFVKAFNLPTLILGGGGYTMRNVARTWAFETGQLVGVEMDPVLPFTDYYEYYSPDHELDVRPSNMDNANSPEYLQRIKQQVLENLRRTQAVPSVQMQDVPRHALGGGLDEDDEDDNNAEEMEDRLDDEEVDAEEGKDRRYTQRLWERKTVRDDELSESEDEELMGRLGVAKQPARPRRRGIMDFVNPHAPVDNSGPGTPVADDARSLNGMDEGEAEGEVEVEAARREVAKHSLDGQMDGTMDVRTAFAPVSSAAPAAAIGVKVPAPTSRSPAPDFASSLPLPLPTPDQPVQPQREGAPRSPASEAGAREADDVQREMDVDVEDEGADQSGGAHAHVPAPAHREGEIGGDVQPAHAAEHTTASHAMPASAPEPHVSHEAESAEMESERAMEMDVDEPSTSAAIREREEGLQESREETGGDNAAIVVGRPEGHSEGDAQDPETRQGL